MQMKLLKVFPEENMSRVSELWEVCRMRGDPFLPWDPVIFTFSYCNSTDNCSSKIRRNSTSLLIWLRNGIFCLSFLPNINKYPIASNHMHCYHLNLSHIHPESVALLQKSSYGSLSTFTSPVCYPQHNNQKDPF